MRTQCRGVPQDDLRWCVGSKWWRGLDKKFCTATPSMRKTFFVLAFNRFPTAYLQESEGNLSWWFVFLPKWGELWSSCSPPRKVWRQLVGGCPTSKNGTPFSFVYMWTIIPKYVSWTNNNASVNDTIPFQLWGTFKEGASMCTIQSIEYLKDKKWFTIFERRESSIKMWKCVNQNYMGWTSQNPAMWLH